jgi:hypothetical protein
MLMELVSVIIRHKALTMLQQLLYGACLPPRPRNSSGSWTPIFPGVASGSIPRDFVWTKSYSSRFVLVSSLFPY